MTTVSEGKLNDFITIAGVIQSQAITAGATGVLSGAIDMAKFGKLQAVIMSGTLGTSGTLDAKFVESDASGGTYTAISGRAITQLVKATDDNKVCLLELKASDIGSGKRYVKLNLVAGTANATSAAVVLGAPLGNADASENNVTIAESK